MATRTLKCDKIPAGAAHPMAQIAAGAMTQVSKDSAHADSKKVATFDDRAAGNLLAAEVMARVRQQAHDWHGYAVRVIGFTIEAREAFLQAIKADIKDIKAKNVIGTQDAKAAARLVNSATTNVSELTTIAKAFNGGASVDGLRQWARKTINGTDTGPMPKLDQIGKDLIVAYARTFSESKAGRKADTWAVKLGKFLERNLPSDDDTAGRAQYDAVVKLYNSFKG